MTPTGAVAGLAERLAPVVGAGQLLTDPVELAAYECDGLTHYRVVPALAVLARSTDDVRAVVAECAAARVPFVARGAGTGLSGGAVLHATGVLIVMAKMREILECDVASQRAVLEPGVANLDVSRAVSRDGYYYAPDPSSQQVCSIGGNVAENSGGAHCLKYGFTTNHVTGLELVTPDGELSTLGGKAADPPGYDLIGAFVGSEGTLGIVTKVIVRLLRSPESVQTVLAAFDGVDSAGAAVSAIIAAGMVPAAIEMMDALAITAAEAAVGCGYPEGAGAVLIVELDGPAVDVDAGLEEVRRHCLESGAFEIRLAADDAERARIWVGRKSAFAAVGRISPDYIVQDGVVPRTALEEVLHDIAALSASTGIRVANVFHAGDGNLHPLVLFDARREGELARAEEVSARILELCLDHGGSITGEHGVGLDKAKAMSRMFSEDDLDTMLLLRRAFDPEGLCNPGKLFPTPRLCGEPQGRGAGPHPLVESGAAELLMGLLEELAGACPDAGARTAGAGDAFGGVTPEIVTYPRRNEDVAAVAGLAASHHRTVVVRGAGTKLDWASPPRSAQVVVDLSRMDRVLEHSSGDLVARVEAGTRLAALDRRLAEARQWLPVDEVVPGSTVGGVVATGLCGPSRYLHGAVRDLVIGMTVVRADGVVARSGSRVVKNVAGYDLAELFTGSYGTLGIVTEVIFRLRPAPLHRRYVTVTCDDEAALAAALAAALQSRSAPTAIEVERRLPAGPIALTVLLDGRAGPVDERARAVSGLLGSCDVSARPPEGFGALPGPVTLKVTTELRSVATLLDLVRRLAAERRLLPVVRGSAGAGVLFVGLDAAGPASTLAAFLDDLRVRCGPLGGSAYVLRAPADVNVVLDVWGPVPGLALMRRVKQQFDPDGRLAPGRFVGGI